MKNKYLHIQGSGRQFPFQIQIIFTGWPCSIHLYAEYQ